MSIRRSAWLLLCLSALALLPTACAIEGLDLALVTAAPPAVAEMTATPAPAVTTLPPDAAPSDGDNPTGKAARGEAAEPTTTPTFIPRLIQLTDGGCCVRPFFSADGQQVRFIDKPAPDAPSGIYGVSVAAETLADPANFPQVPKLRSETIGFLSPDQTVVARPDPANPQLMLFTNTVNDKSWTVDTGGNWPVFSADGQYIYWNSTDRRGPYDERPTTIWWSRIDGSEMTALMTLYGGGAIGWFPDGQRLLLTGRQERIGEEESLLVLSLADGSLLELAREKRLQDGLISPGGSWVIYLTTFSDDPAQDGLWAVRADGSERRQLDFFGPYRWLDDSRLTYIPVRASIDESLVVWQLNVETGAARPLTDPTTLSFAIADGDWTLSPDGRKLVFVSALDKNLWLITLP